ncbi:glycine oxidase ThiO [Agrobacterium rosae]|uniref:Glycine oxidase ThiO n=1 Tax=Agrobacterium rosae TaxID=1972867 RepID=A0AAE5VN07_9HYPH|nr:glycine oxidase ThiO [Agrobacterium rosae]KAA3510373.1 glycine oxidase ThiO [Agrobacterium rosae]KAA3517093.1 glycine oxidase ThiO [Agrobacterium rosae]MCM2434523.1 glycine oxidase ThiO [Agrobacterium rosae]MDX8330063.1 glycine oxidase ThiO [Agrobacterium rosae]MQB49804.1 glycine oxidase ThiO [Agrobacterium rosae]
MRILIKGAGVAGLTAALELARHGMEVAVCDLASEPGRGASWYAGGMLAPWCERESAEETVLTLGQSALDWWDEATPGLVKRKGTLVVAPARDKAELSRFASRTSGYRWVDKDEIAVLEPDLAGRFRVGLFFEREGHLDPRLALSALYERLVSMGARFHFGGEAMDEGEFDHVIDCTGAAQTGKLSGLRGVRGEMLYLSTGEVTLSRPVRLLHPRIPLYIVPREAGRFMVGATMIETDEAGPITARSMMELLNAAYALHPAFGEAQIIETGAGIRPAFADNLPSIREEDGTLFINGAHRHGFLLSPAMAQQAADIMMSKEVYYENSRQRARA